MIKILLLLGLFFTSLFFFGCGSTNADTSLQKIEFRIEKQPEPINEKLLTNQTVNFKGVSFSYNPQVFTEIKPEEIAETPLENETDKPGGEYPKHVSFNIKIANQNQEGTLKILPIEDYRRMYAISKSNTEFFDERLIDLQKFLKNKNFRRDGQIPFIPFYDASQTFQAKVENFSFQNGKGAFFLTQYDQDSFDPVTNEDLTYIYQGISDDGKNYILATLPVSVSFLPNNYDGVEPEDNKLLRRWMTNGDIGRYEEYVAKIKKRLNDLPPGEFQPNLKYYEEIISSLKIEK